MSFPRRLVQSPSGVYAGTAACTVTLTNAFTAGNLILVPIINDTDVNATVVSIVDQAGNVYLQVPAVRATEGTAHTSDIWYCANCKGGATTVVVTMSAGACGAAVLEISGMSLVNIVDAKGVTNNGNSATPTGPTLTTFNRNCVGVSSIATATAITSVNPPWTLMGVLNGNSFAHFLSPNIFTNAIVYNQSAGVFCLSVCYFVPTFPPMVGVGAF